MSLIFTLKIKNHKDEIYELTHDYDHYYVKSITGLTPPPTTINSGNVAIFATQKATALGAKVVALSDSNGYIRYFR